MRQDLGSRRLAWTRRGLSSDVLFRHFHLRKTSTLFMPSTRPNQKTDLHPKFRRASKRTTAIWRQSRYMGAMAQADGAITTSLRDVVMRLAPGWLAGAASARIQKWSRPD